MQRNDCNDIQNTMGTGTLTNKENDQQTMLSLKPKVEINNNNWRRQQNDTRQWQCQYQRGKEIEYNGGMCHANMIVYKDDSYLHIHPSCWSLLS